MTRCARRVTWVVFLVALFCHTVTGCGIQRLFSAQCDALAGQDAQDVLSRLAGSVIGADVYDATNEVFKTEIGLVGGFEYSKSQFCNGLDDNRSLPDCLGIRDFLPDQVEGGYRINITANCSRAATPSNDGDRMKQVDRQLTESLRSFNRAILYETQIVSQNESTGEGTVQFTMPLVTDDTDKASQYANASLMYFFHVQRQNLACLRKWDMSANKTETRGIFGIMFSYIIDPGCDTAPECEHGWRPAGNEAVACEGSVCYTRGRCVPDTCSVGRFGSSCEKCPPNTYSLKAGQQAKNMSACDAIPTGNTDCGKIIDIKTGECSAGMSADHKKKMSLVLNVDCLENGGVKLVWGEGPSEVEAKLGEVKEFLGTILNVSAADIVLDFQARVVEEFAVGGARRRLLQDSGGATDDGSTEITFSVQAATTTTAAVTTTPAPTTTTTTTAAAAAVVTTTPTPATTTTTPAPTTAPVTTAAGTTPPPSTTTTPAPNVAVGPATTTPPPAKNEPHNYAVVAIVIPAAVFIFCCLLSSTQSPQPERTRAYRAMDAPPAQATQYLPLHYNVA